MLELYEPQVEDLWFKEKMMGDEQTMSYNHAYGGIIPFPKEYWADWHNRWITNHNGKRFYRYIKDRETFVGDYPNLQRCGVGVFLFLPPQHP